MMRALLSDQMGDFAAVYDEAVELVSLLRPTPNAVASLAERLFASRQVIQAQWEQAAGDSDAPLLALSPAIDADGLRALATEVAFAGQVLSELLGCERIGIRVTTLRAPMCPRFHADQVPCRMLITIRGQGTEWIPSDEVDRSILSSRDTEAPPLRAGGDIKQLTTGSWSLLKGGAWDERFGGVVHRSPHLAGERLLLTMDPLFTGGTDRDEARAARHPSL